MNYIIDKNHPTKTSSLEQAVKISSRDLFKIGEDVKIPRSVKLVDLEVTVKNEWTLNTKSNEITARARKTIDRIWLTLTYPNE